MSDEVQIGPPCPKCGTNLRYRDCWAIGCEDGEINQFDSDPLWFGSYEDAWETCDECDGKGYVEWCPTCDQVGAKPS